MIQECTCKRKTGTALTQVYLCAGRTAEFVVIQVLMAICLVTLALTVRIETFFVLSAVAGVQRAVFHVVPFAVISDVTRAQVISYDIKDVCLHTTHVHAINT